MSNVSQVLKQLESAGKRGVFSYDLIPYGGIRYSARVQDLKDMGYDIVSRPETRGATTGCRYFLIENGQQPLL